MHETSTVDAPCGGADDRPSARDATDFVRAALRARGRLAADLRTRASGDAELAGWLARVHAEDAPREDRALWLRRRCDAAASEWILAAVFARALEDHGLAGADGPWLAGPVALARERAFYAAAPARDARHYALAALRQLARAPALSELLAALTPHVAAALSGTPATALAPSPAGARELLALAREPDAASPATRLDAAGERLLGDLYQALSDDARERYALLQTPDFVARYLLDHALEPALEAFPLAEVDLLDPACGSGHLLIDAFRRLLARQRAAAPGASARELAARALAAVAGVDLNPRVVAIARFRLTLAYLDAAGLREPRRRPPRLRLAVGDALIAGKRDATPDDDEADALLRRRYAVVLANPPYITVKDPELRARYRRLYPDSTAGKYALSAPFLERCFELARAGGFVGQITANSFTRRRFGKPLIERVLNRVDLRRVVNAEGAYIPGHGTPTILLFGRNQPPASASVHAILARRGEPSVPRDPARGHVWTSIAARGDELGYEDDFITVEALPRAALARHPWSLRGGCARALQEHLERRAPARLGDLATSIGFMAITGEDECFARPAGAWRRGQAEAAWLRPLATGEDLRDWQLDRRRPLELLFPYEGDALRPPARYPALARMLWPYRELLARRRCFGGESRRAQGRPWYGYHQIPLARLRSPLVIAYAEVATHNHFVLDRGAHLFNQTAPTILLDARADEDDHLALLAYLNSSLACFWMKQVAYNKGARGQGGGLTAADWEQFYQFSGSRLRALPLPPLDAQARAQSIELARELLTLADERGRVAALSEEFDRARDGPSLRAAIARRRAALRELEARLRALQERLDWLLYTALDLCDAACVGDEREVPPGGRAFELALARRALAGRPGQRYLERCRLPDAERLARRAADPGPLLAARLAAIARSRWLSTLERPVYKRIYREGFRDPAEPQALARAGRRWLQDRIERALASSPCPRAADELTRGWDAAPVLPVLEVVFERTPRDAPALAAELLARAAAPYLARQRYRDAGLEKRALWERAWALQDLEDRGAAAPGAMSQLGALPRYAARDYRGELQRLRGKLDAPRERYIRYPQAGPDGRDLYAWAGWDALTRARALASLHRARAEEGAPAALLAALLDGIDELLPSLARWHTDAREREDLALAAFRRLVETARR